MESSVNTDAAEMEHAIQSLVPVLRLLIAERRRGEK